MDLATITEVIITLIMEIITDTTIHTVIMIVSHTTRAEEIPPLIIQMVKTEETLRQGVPIQEASVRSEIMAGVQITGLPG